MSNKMGHATATMLLALAIGGCSNNTPDQLQNNSPGASSAEDGRTRPLATAQIAASQDGQTLSATANNGAAATPTPNKRQADLMYLPVESKFISNNELRIDVAGEALQSKNFDTLARTFEIDSASDGNALNLTDLYKQAIKNQVGPTGQLVSFSCGLSLCLGALRTGAPEKYDSWTQKFFADKATPSYSFADSIVKLAENNYEGRFMFSTDPAANSMTGAAGARSKKR